MAILVTRLATAVSSRKTPKMEINRNFRGLLAFSANVARDKTEEQEIPVRWSKVPRALEPVNRVRAILVTRVATAVSSRKTPKTAINRDFPGLRAFSANVARGRNEAQEIPHPMLKSAARFGAPKLQLWQFLSPGWPRPFQAEKHPKWK